VPNKQIDNGFKLKMLSAFSHGFLATLRCQHPHVGESTTDTQEEPVLRSLRTIKTKS